MLAIRGKPVFLHGNHGTAPCVCLATGHSPAPEILRCCDPIYFCQKKTPGGYRVCEGTMDCRVPVVTIPFEIHPTMGDTLPIPNPMQSLRT